MDLELRRRTAVVTGGRWELGRRHERTLLATHELRERLRLLRMTDVDLLVVGQPIPDARPDDGDEPVIDLLRVLWLLLERPIDPDGRVPSLFRLS